MSNISSIISGHNKNLLNPTVSQYGCNCRIKEDCPLQNQFLTPNIIYGVDVKCKANNNYNFYLGVAQTIFKEIFQNRKRHFSQRQNSKSEELFKCIRSLKHAGTPYTINWSIIVKVKGSAEINNFPLCFTKNCSLIGHFNNVLLLSKYSEFINACRHDIKLLLKSLKNNDSMDQKNIKLTDKYFCILLI